MAYFLRQGSLVITPMNVQILTSPGGHAAPFSSAITRHPVASVVDGFKCQKTGAVDINLMTKQHIDYQEAFRLASVFVKRVLALPELTYAPFVSYLNFTSK